ncbi:rab GTPase-activating protein 1-like, partial [Lampetra fluviatilis]
MAEVAGARKVSCSSDSVSTPNSEDFVLVPGSPAAPPPGSDGTGLKIPGAGNESALQEQLAAMLSDCAQDEEEEADDDDEQEEEEEATTRGEPHSAEGEGASVMAERTDGEMSDSQTVANNPRCSKEGPRGPDSASPTSSRSSRSLRGDDDCEDCDGAAELLVFPRVTYLGSASVDAPRSELEALRVAAILRQQCLAPLEVALAVPTASGGSVRILEADSSVEIARYPVQRILFCVRGHRATQESDCFGFTESHNAADIFRIHVFRCPEPHEVSRLLHSFAAAFEVCARPSGAGSSGPGSSPALTASTPNPDLFTFTVAMEIREDDGKGNFSAVPVDKEKQYFKLRSGVEKKLVLNVNQASSRELTIERCFGVFLGPGCGVQPGDLHLLNMESMGKSSDSKSYVIAARWDPTLATFHGLNDETAKDKMAHLTVAADLVVTEVQDPVRFLFEAPARVFPATERFWYFGRRAFTDTFHLHLRQLPPRDETTPDEARACPYELLALTSESERQRAATTATAATTTGGAGGGLA